MNVRDRFFYEIYGQVKSGEDVSLVSTDLGAPSLDPVPSLSTWFMADTVIHSGGYLCPILVEPILTYFSGISSQWSLTGLSEHLYL